MTSMDEGRGVESMGVGVQTTLPDSGREKAKFTIRRWDADASSWVSRKLGGEEVGQPGFIQPNLEDFERLGVAPYGVSEFVGNLITQAGWGRVLEKAIGSGSQAYDATHTRIGFGTATAAATTAQTSLQATGTAAFWKLVSAVGTTAAGTGTGTARLTFVAVVGTADGAFAWQEFATDQGTADATGNATAPLLNRAVSNQGTKATGQTWTATEELMFT
jgi:hypothetical protein